MKRILIVVDMQHDFIDGVLPADGGQLIVERVAEKLRMDWDRIFVTMDTHTLAYGTTVEGQTIREHCMRGTKGWKLIREVAEEVTGVNHDRAYIIEKKDSFAELSEIQDRIEQMVATTPTWVTEDFEIEICGVCTDICVISNALLLRSIFPKFKITVDASCCAGTSKETHDAALKVMNGCLIDVVNDNV